MDKVRFMGYTHYWYVRPETDPTTLAAARSDMEKLIETVSLFGFQLAGPAGEPDTSPGELEGRWGFNGVDDDSYEAFLWPPSGAYGTDENGYLFEFCKTNWRQYDAVVVACLLAAKHHLGNDMRITSDAEEPEAWEPGEALYRATFDREPPVTWPGDAEVEE